MDEESEEVEEVKVMMPIKKSAEDDKHGPNLPLI